MVEWIISDGLTEYDAAVAFMEARASAIAAGREDEAVWLVEHPPLYTAGTSARIEDLTDPDRFPVHPSKRGGQYTYHGPGQAHGLAFSVPEGMKLPPSLRNIYKELESDLSTAPRADGDLTRWARQGVLLLNTALTVEQGNAASHRGKGWEHFTDRAIETVSQHAESCVFLLWGSHARQKKALIDTSRHLVLESPHPSPLSAHRGFFGNHHFSRANQFLQEQGRTPIEWQLPETP